MKFIAQLHRILPGLFMVSVACPVVASSLAADVRPRWLGIADVVLAAVVAAGAITLSVDYRHRIADADRLAAQRVSERLLGLIPATLLLFFLVGDRLDWTVLVVGLAWRTWLLLYTLPALIAVRREAGNLPDSRSRSTPEPPGRDRAADRQ